MRKDCEAKTIQIVIIVMTITMNTLMKITKKKTMRIVRKRTMKCQKKKSRLRGRKIRNFSEKFSISIRKIYLGWRLISMFSGTRKQRDL